MRVRAPCSGSRPPRTLTQPALVVALISFLVLSGCGSASREASSCAPPPAKRSPATTLGDPGSTAPPDSQQPVQRLAEEVSEAGAMMHLQALQAIADRTGGNRASPGPGYEASVDYVVEVLNAA